MWHTNYQRYARVNPAFVQQVRFGRSWPMNIALLAAGVVVVLPLLILLLAAFAVAVIAYLAVSGVITVRRWVAGILGGEGLKTPSKTGRAGHDGRENVRVMDS